MADIVEPVTRGNCETKEPLFSADRLQESEEHIQRTLARLQLEQKQCSHPDAEQQSRLQNIHEITKQQQHLMDCAKTMKHNVNGLVQDSMFTLNCSRVCKDGMFWMFSMCRVRDV